MALADLQAFLQQRAVAFDATIDVSSGSPYDVQVIQPVLSRLGTDPFTVDMGTFLQDRLNQEFPGMSTKEGDAITDFLIKPAMALWDPLVRENLRVKQNLSFKNPTLLTLDEADALGANLFATRNAGNTASGVARIYYAQPQDSSITPANFISSIGGLNFFPTQVQSISVQEMLFNKENNLYYFDVNVVAEQPGDQYNIDPNQLVTIANVGAAVLVTNKLRFRFGIPAEDSATFIGRVDQDLTERSLVTVAGITAQIAGTFSEVTRLAVTGFQDPEMQRDVISGGGLGAVLVGGVALNVVSDGQNQLLSRRIQIGSTEVSNLGIDFAALIGPVGPVAPGTFTLTIHSAYAPGTLPVVRDLQVLAVVSSDTLDVAETVLNYQATNVPWTLRANTLTLSGIPGGILFPNGPGGIVTVPPNQIHIGGATDIFVRGSAFDSESLIISDIVDDQPLLSGMKLSIDGSGDVTLQDFVLGTNYATGDATDVALKEAVGLTFQILDPPIAGTYRIIATEAPAIGSSPILTVTPAPTSLTGTYRWRLLSEIFIDLVEPKETRISGADLSTVQGVDIVTTASSIDFGDLGVSTGDTLRILSGQLIIGDYTVKSVLSPFFTKIQVDRGLPATLTGVKYEIFRPNADGGIQLPFVRIDSIALLDTSNQPVGSNIPFADPIDIQSASFANAAHGIKADFNDATLGVVSLLFPSGTFSDLVGLTLHMSWNGGPGGGVTVTFASGTTTPSSVVAQINTTVNADTGGGVTRIAALVGTGGLQFGLIPVGALTTVDAGSALIQLFGSSGPYTSRDIRSVSTNFFNLRPAIDLNFDVAQVVDGLQIGFYDHTSTNALKENLLTTAHDFTPESGRHVQVGARSLGSARLYFLEPTSIEFDVGSSVMLTNKDGSLVEFFPDPTLTYQRIPALPTGAKPLDGVSVSGVSFTSASTDFIEKGIVPGDQLVIDYVPLIGSVVLADPVPGLSLQNLIISIGGGTDKKITFVTDSLSIPPGSVTRQGVADLINRTVGQVIATINSANKLQFNPTTAITVRSTGTANGTLGFSTSVDSTNASLNFGTYTIVSLVSQHVLSVTPPIPSSESNEQFSVFSLGVQRIISTTMSAQVAETGLYYFDLELISQGTGDQYNINANLQMTAKGYKSDGYYLTTDDPNLTFSTTEKVKLHISPTILEVGVTDDPDNATQISGQNIQINYDMSVITGSVQNFVLADTERVVNESPLSRHLIPYFVRLALSYVGGSQTSVVSDDINTLILGLFPSDQLRVSDLEGILSNRGATSIDNPINLIAVIHNFDRTVQVERSQNELNTGRLAAFIPDVIGLTRGISSS